MELRLERGDYRPDGTGGMERADGERALLQRVIFRLTARRGAFPLLPKLGSQLHLLAREKPAARHSTAMRFVQQALEEEQVAVEQVTLEQEGDRMRVAVQLLWQGRSLGAQVTV